jgi:hypothetical protein
MVKALKELVELMANRPWIIFIVLTLAFGYAYYDQNEDIDEQYGQINMLSLEVGGLRKEVEKMNEIIILKVALAAKECPIEE